MSKIALALSVRAASAAFFATAKASSISVFVSPPCLAPIMRTAVSTLEMCFSTPDNSLLRVQALPTNRPSKTIPVVIPHFQSVLGIDSTTGWESYSKGSTRSISCSWSVLISNCVTTECFEWRSAISVLADFHGQLGKGGASFGGQLGAQRKFVENRVAPPFAAASPNRIWRIPRRRYAGSRGGPLGGSHWPKN